MRLLLGLLFFCAAFIASAQEPSSGQFRLMLKKVMEETKVNLRTEMSGEVSEFESDGDPMTLEIVFLKHLVSGATTVSDDGDVIFLFEPSDEVQREPIGKAFQIRTQFRLAGK